MTRVTVATLGVWALLLSAASAQPMQQDEVGTDAPPAESVISPRTVASALAQLEREAALQTTAPQTAWAAEGRACPGCPKRSVAKALIQTTVINGLYELANLARGQVTAEITPETWWENMQQGWVWDLDDFTVNQVGHPYQGSNYFDAGRANGLSFYESAAVAAFGSSTWEYFGETNHPSINDFINTTLGGIALGEMLHRTAWLVRSPRTTGMKRFWNEFGAMAIDPVTGLNRIVLSRGPRPSRETARHDAVEHERGSPRPACWRGTNSAFESDGDPFLEADAIYGNPDEGRSRTPYDAFAVRGRFGGGSSFSEARVRGRLMAQPFAGGKGRFSVLQATTTRRTMPTPPAPSRFEATVGTDETLRRSDEPVPPRLGRADRACRDRFAAARRRGNSGRGRGDPRAMPGRACRKGRASTTTGRARPSASRGG